MTRRSISVAVLLPSTFAAVVIVLVLITDPKLLPSGALVFFGGLPWNIGYVLMLFALGLLLDVPLRLAGFPNPFSRGGNLWGVDLWDGWFANGVFIACLFINVFACLFITLFGLYVAGRWIDRAIERLRRRSAGTQP